MTMYSLEYIIVPLQHNRYFQSGYSSHSSLVNVGVIHFYSNAIKPTEHT